MIRRKTAVQFLPQKAYGARTAEKRPFCIHVYTSVHICIYVYKCVLISAHLYVLAPENL